MISWGGWAVGWWGLAGLDMHLTPLQDELQEERLWRPPFPLHAHSDRVLCVQLDEAKARQEQLEEEADSLGG